MAQSWVGGLPLRCYGFCLENKAKGARWVLAGRSGYGLWFMGMKITLELPDALGRRFKATVPNSQRSKLVAELLAERLGAVEESLERAAKKANTLTRVNRDMQDWKALNEAED